MRKSLLHRKGGLGFDKSIRVLASLVIVAIIGFGILWLIKSWGEATEQYGNVLIKTKKQSMTLNCQISLQAIWKDIQIYAIENNSFPSSLKELSDWAGNPRLMYCPDPNGQEYSYIPGQKMNMSPENVLVYESKAVHKGCCNVLRLSGNIELLATKQVQVAVEKTLNRLKH